MKNNLFKNLLIILLIVIAQQANSQWLVPDYIRNYDSDQPTVYSEDIAGGYHSVSNLAARDAIPEAKREIGMCVTHITGGLYYTYRFEGVNTLDATWENTANWTLIIDENYNVDTSNYALKSDSSNVADTAGYALNIPINTFIDTIYNNSFDSILIADTLLHYRASIVFTLIRNNTSTFGDIYINQINDSKISYYWYNNNLVNSLLFEKVIWDNDIYIKMTDLLINGSDTRIIFNVTYKLK